MSQSDLYMKEYAETLPVFFKLFDGVPPSVDQLEALRYLHMAIIKRIHVGISLMTILFGLLTYTNAFVDPGYDTPYLIFNPVCVLFLIPILISVLMGRTHIRRHRIVLQALSARSTVGLPAPNAFGTEYLFAVRQSGRDYLTHYEIVSLFDSGDDDCILKESL